MLDITGHQGNTNQSNHELYHLTPTGMTNIKKREREINAVKM